MNVFCSIFSQLLQLFPRVGFHRMVKKHDAERNAKGFTYWGQFVSMLLCQLGRAQSLRDIINGLRSCEGKLKHLGISAPKRATLSYANEHRRWELYRDVFFNLFDRCKAEVTGRKRKLRSPGVGDNEKGDIIIRFVTLFIIANNRDFLHTMNLYRF
jgi:hypothetical protein